MNELGNDQDNLQNKIKLIDQIDIGSIIKRSPQESDSVIPGLIRGTVGSIVAQSGIGKSFFSLQLCAAISSGFDSLNISQINEGKTIFLSADDPKEATDDRLYKFGIFLSQNQREVFHNNCRIYSLLGKDTNIFDNDWYDEIKHLSRDTKLVVLDSLRAFHNEDENDSSKMQEILNILGEIAKECDTSILFTHHSTKYDAMNLRGSSVLSNNVKFQINLVEMSSSEAKFFNISENEKRNYVRIIFSKHSAFKPIQDQWLKRDPNGFLKAVSFESSYH